MAAEAAVKDLELSRVFALTLRALFRRPVSALLVAGLTVTLPDELYFRFVSYVEPAFSVDFALYTLGAFGVVAIGAILTAWMTLQFVGADNPAVATFARAPLLWVTDFVVLIVGLLGLLLLIVPGLVWSLATVVVIPAAAVERLGLTRALWRSIHLTEERKGIIFVIVVMVMLPPVAASGSLELWLNDWQLSPEQEDPLITNLTRPVSNTLVSAWGAAMCAALYVELTRLHLLKSDGERERLFPSRGATG